MAVTESAMGTERWQERRLTQVLAVAATLAPLYGFALWTHLNPAPLSLRQLFLYPLLLGGGDVVLILFAYRYVCGQPLARLNRKEGAWWSDLGSGVFLAALFLALLFAQRWAEMQRGPGSSDPPSQALVTLFEGIAQDPVLLAVWLGPVVWIGVAGFEELARAFFLDRLWSVWPGRWARWGVILVSGALFGLVHLYQGPTSVVAIGLQGVLYGVYYLRFGRLWPMIVGHALYDSFQVVQVVRVFGG